MDSQSQPTAAATPHELTLDPLVQAYFDGFNSQDYGAVAALFGADGILIPPFEAGLVGAQAIQAYLHAEAAGMRARPLEVETQTLPDHSRQIIVKGRVATPLFTVSVGWGFVLRADHTLHQVEIRLLASLSELLQFRRS
ncbi:MAG: nuclear transport factor 2 family protein [Nodosilinea sp.]